MHLQTPLLQEMLSAWAWQGKLGNETGRRGGGEAGRQGGRVARRTGGKEAGWFE